MTGLLVEFFLVKVVLLLELLRKLPNYIVLKLKKLTLLFIVLKQDLSLC